ncbi:MAG: GTPase HflX [Lachnospiraceae bacterium]|nr:GTPase HflX [Lachnospiraceae bacterium]
MIETKQARERVVLVGIQLAQGEDMQASLDELEQLAETAGAKAVGRVVQNREQPHPATYLGKGKLEEVKELLWETEATGIVCDDELSPAQLSGLEKILDVKIMDRTLLILDIFAARARTREGKIQVELAQLKYRAARLVGLRDSLSRLGGGIGTRGPGESKLEVDRRRIHERISWLKAQLRDVERHREVTRQKRMDNRIPVTAIVGYTNAGKSTLLNRLTGADILAEDQLFATLDPTTRTLVLPGGDTVLLTDTVGFIRKLPHHLIEAFKSTLEEARYADVILHVVDSVNPQADVQMHVVYETLESLGVKDKTIVTAFNKSDRLAGDLTLRDLRADYSLQISAASGQGLDRLKEMLTAILRARRVYVERFYLYRDAGKMEQFHRYGQVLNEEYREEGIAVAGYLPAEMAAKI